MRTRAASCSWSCSTQTDCDDGDAVTASIVVRSEHGGAIAMKRHHGLSMAAIVATASLLLLTTAAPPPERRSSAPTSTRTQILPTVHRLTSVRRWGRAYGS